jgi:SAM-dependent methyltransferase
MTKYPIPKLRLPPGEGKLFLEIGCSWGRWCIAAARNGYRPIGIDPSLKGIRAARRVAMQLGIDAHYIVADGRHLPFRDEAFGQVFSYSVLQHIDDAAVAETLAEIHRVLLPQGRSLIQMPNLFGIRCLYQQLRRGYRKARDFEVRYWRPNRLRSVFAKLIGATRVSVDGYFSLNAQFSDLRFLPKRYQAVVLASELLRRASEQIPQLSYFADSLYLSSSKS